MGIYLCKHSVLIRPGLFFFIASSELTCKFKVRSRMNLDPACEINLDLCSCSKVQAEGLLN